MVITATVLLSGETAASATNTLEKFSWMISFRLVLLTLYTVTELIAALLGGNSQPAAVVDPGGEEGAVHVQGKGLLTVLKEKQALSAGVIDTPAEEEADRTGWLRGVTSSAYWSPEKE